MDEVSAVDFDHHAPEIAADPYPTYRALREQCPVGHSARWGGFWVVSRYRDVVHVAKNDPVYASGDGVSLPSIGQQRRLIPIELDPPGFHLYRRLLNPFFSPAVAEQLETTIRSTVRELIGRLPDDRFDAVALYAQPIPAITTLTMLGLDAEQWAWFLKHIHIAAHESAGNLEVGVDAMLEVYREVAVALDERRERIPQGDPDDFLAALVSAQADGRPLPEEAMLDIVMLLLLGGLDTTASLIGGALLDLADHPERRAELRSDPKKIPGAVEEYLRYISPVQGLARTVREDTELGGQQIKAGEKIWMLWAAANRDPAEFDDPDGVHLDRAPNRHLAFGVGIHRCLGMHIARVMAKVALEEFLQAFPEFHVADVDGLAYYRDAGVVVGLTSLPLAVGPASTARSDESEIGTRRPGISERAFGREVGPAEEDGG